MEIVDPNFVHLRRAALVKEGIITPGEKICRETETITVRLRTSSAVEVLAQKLKHKGQMGKNWPQKVTGGLLRDILLKVSKVTSD